MGTVQYYTDADGNDVGLHDHEGYVELEVAGPWFMDAESRPDLPPHDYAPLDETTGTHWTTSWSSNRPAHTGRYRSACDCGWTGPIFHIDVDDPMGDPDEITRDRLMEDWAIHANEQIALVAVEVAAGGERRAVDSVFAAVRRARQAGRSWAQIAQALGVTKQSAHERFRRVDDDTTREGDDR